jgi:hypothetical protein
MMSKSEGYWGLDLGLKRVGYVRWVDGQIVEAGVKEIENFNDLYVWALKTLSDQFVVVEVPVPFGRPPTAVLQMAAQIGIIWTVVDEMVCISRPDIKMTLLKTTRAKDKDIRDYLRNELSNYAVILAPNIKLKGDAWSALAALWAFFKDPLVGKKGQSLIWNKLVNKQSWDVSPHETAEVIDDEEALKELLKEGDE